MVGLRRRDNADDRLTGREREVLKLMARGCLTRASRGSSTHPAAIEKHVTSMFSKLGLAPKPLQHRRVMAVLTLLRASDGLAPLRRCPLIQPLAVSIARRARSPTRRRSRDIATGRLGRCPGSQICTG